MDNYKTIKLADLTKRIEEKDKLIDDNFFLLFRSTESGGTVSEEGIKSKESVVEMTSKLDAILSLLQSVNAKKEDDGGLPYSAVTFAMRADTVQQSGVKVPFSIRRACLMRGAEEAIEHGDTRQLIKVLDNACDDALFFNMKKYLDGWDSSSSDQPVENEHLDVTYSVLVTMFSSNMWKDTQVSQATALLKAFSDACEHAKRGQGMTHSFPMAMLDGSDRFNTLKEVQAVLALMDINASEPLTLSSTDFDILQGHREVLTKSTNKLARQFVSIPISGKKLEALRKAEGSIKVQKLADSKIQALQYYLKNPSIQRQLESPDSAAQCLAKVRVDYSAVLATLGVTGETGKQLLLLHEAKMSFATDELNAGFQKWKAHHSSVVVGEAVAAALETLSSFVEQYASGNAGSGTGIPDDAAGEHATAFLEKINKVIELISGAAYTTSLKTYATEAQVKEVSSMIDGHVFHLKILATAGPRLMFFNVDLDARRTGGAGAGTVPVPLQQFSQASQKSGLLQCAPLIRMLGSTTSDVYFGCGAPDAKPDPKTTRLNDAWLKARQLFQAQIGNVVKQTQKQMCLSTPFRCMAKATWLVLRSLKHPDLELLEGDALKANFSLLDGMEFIFKSQPRLRQELIDLSDRNVEEVVKSLQQYSEALSPLPEQSPLKNPSFSFSHQGVKVQLSHAVFLVPSISVLMKQIAVIINAVINSTYADFETDLEFCLGGMLKAATNAGTKIEIALKKLNEACDIQGATTDGLNLKIIGEGSELDAFGFKSLADFRLSFQVFSEAINPCMQQWLSTNVTDFYTNSMQDVRSQLDDLGFKKIWEDLEQQEADTEWDIDAISEYRRKIDHSSVIKELFDTHLSIEEAAAVQFVARCVGASERQSQIERLTVARLRMQ